MQRIAGTWSPRDLAREVAHGLFVLALTGSSIGGLFAVVALAVGW